jgi:hypothetical protein
MTELLRKDVVGQRIAEIVISVPDKPVTMDGQSFSAGYVRLASGVLIDLCGAAPPLQACPADLQALKRDRAYEAEFRAALGKRISDTRVPALAWDRPCLHRLADFDLDTEPLWPT